MLNFRGFETPEKNTGERLVFFEAFEASASRDSILSPFWTPKIPTPPKKNRPTHLKNMRSKNGLPPPGQLTLCNQRTWKNTNCAVEAWQDYQGREKYQLLFLGFLRCLRCLENMEKINQMVVIHGDLPWCKSKSHLKQTKAWHAMSFLRISYLLNGRICPTRTCPPLEKSWRQSVLKRY